MPVFMMASLAVFYPSCYPIVAAQALALVVAAFQATPSAHPQLVEPGAGNPAETCATTIPDWRVGSSSEVGFGKRGIGTTPAQSGRADQPA